jgi:hypothetical protein
MKAERASLRTRTRLRVLSIDSEGARQERAWRRASDGDGVRTSCFYRSPPPPPTFAYFQPPRFTRLFYLYVLCS